MVVSIRAGLVFTFGEPFAVFGITLGRLRLVTLLELEPRPKLQKASTEILHSASHVDKEIIESKHMLSNLDTL